METLTNLKDWWSSRMDFAACYVEAWTANARRRHFWLHDNLANLISIVRLPLMLPLLWWLWNIEPAWRIVPIVAIGIVQVLDGLDGAVARRLGTTMGTTRGRGAIIDGTVDKLCTLLFVALLLSKLISDPATAVMGYVALAMLLVAAAIQARSAHFNNQRREIFADRRQEFRSRPPAQFAFVGSMLLIAGAWLITSQWLAAAYLSAWAMPAVIGLSAWSMADYAKDARRLEAWPLFNRSPECAK